METFIFKNSLNKNIEIGSNSDLFLIEKEGLTAAEIIPTVTQGYKQNGDSLLNVQLGTRLILIKFLVYGKSAADFYNKRALLSSIFNPLLGEGTLIYKNDILTRAISVQVSAMPTETETYSENLKVFEVEFTAHNPLWFDLMESAVKLGEYASGLTFPFKFNDSITFAKNGSIATINIEGDVPSPIKVEFKGGAVNPKLSLINTGEFIQINTVVNENEELIITTEYGNKMVSKKLPDGTIQSANHLITSDSTFFHLRQGENKISFGTNNTSETEEIYVYWRNYYLGV